MLPNGVNRIMPRLGNLKYFGVSEMLLLESILFNGVVAILYGR